jgi:hypothetical protein
MPSGAASGIGGARSQHAVWRTQVADGFADAVRKLARAIMQKAKDKDINGRSNGRGRGPLVLAARLRMKLRGTRASPDRRLARGI